MNPGHWFHFGCPVYVLNANLQSGKKIDKWSDRARVGIYLGRSPQHSRNVALVLSLTTGLVSPQFHVKADTTFQTIRKAFGGAFPTSMWQDKCHFLRDEINLKQETAKASSSKAATKQSQPNESIRQEGASIPQSEVETPDAPSEDTTTRQVHWETSNVPETPVQEQVQEPQEQQPTAQVDDGRRRSGRKRTKTQRYIEHAMMTELEKPSHSDPYFVAFEALAVPRDEQFQRERSFEHLHSIAQRS